MLLAIDTHSYAFQVGQDLGQWVIPALILVLVGWVGTRTWRKPVARTLDDAPRVAAMRRQRRNVSVLVTLLIVGAAVIAVVLDVGSDPSYGPAAQSGPTGRTVDAPATVAGYHLITGDAAAGLAARMPRTTSDRFWFYAATPDDTRPSVLLSANTVQWDAKFAQENAMHSLSWALFNFFAGAKIDDPQDVDAGPLGGLMQCGTRAGSTAVLCRWNDASTGGAVIVYGTTDISRASAIALQFRNGAEH